MTDNMEVTTADMLEIWIGGGNGSEYVDGVGLCETAAKELRELHVEITRLRAENERLREELQQERAKHPARIGAVSLIARAALKGDSDE